MHAGEQGLAAAGRVEDLAQRLQSVGMSTIEDVHASALWVDHTGFLQLSEVVADGRFGQPESSGEIAGTYFAGVVGEQDRHQLDSNGICKGLEP